MNHMAALGLSMQAAMQAPALGKAPRMPPLAWAAGLPAPLSALQPGPAWKARRLHAAAICNAVAGDGGSSGSLEPSSTAAAQAPVKKPGTRRAASKRGQAEEAGSLTAVVGGSQDGGEGAAGASGGDGGDGGAAGAKARKTRTRAKAGEDTEGAGAGGEGEGGAPKRKARQKKQDPMAEREAELQPVISSSRPAATPAPAFDPASLHVCVPPASGRWSSLRHWLVFSDLHVHPRTLDVALEVLRRVHSLAAERNAGVLFLGDFWDERGALPVYALNAVLRELGTWTQPMLMLVGNHDQVNLGGESHALTPLQMAFAHRVHVFSAPTLWRGALWLPYRRDHSILRDAIGAAGSGAALPEAEAPAGSSGGQVAADAPAPASGVSAVFAHADVQTARYNHLVQARDGLPPDTFPPGVPTFSGHYHLPHRVANTDITYVGSPYQVTAAEAGESKRLLLLDADAGWSVVDELPFVAGPRHRRVASLEEAMQLVEAEPGAVQAGDRVKCTVPAEEDKEAWEKAAQGLRARGARVEIVHRPPAVRAPRIAEAEDKGPLELLREYAAARGGMSADAEAAAADALRAEAAAGGTAGGGAAARHVSLEFGRLSVEGFGPFRERQEYSLGDRGLRVISGRNEDDGAAESNGAGKTSLVAAPLWALTGEVLARTEGAGAGGIGGRILVDSMLNDQCATGCVRLEGRVNDRPFVVERTVRKGKTRLHFELDGVSQDQQDKSATQDLVDQTFNRHLLRHAVFYGQNDITTILEADDKAFKDLLGKVVEMEVWDRAQERVRTERSAVKSDSLATEGVLRASEERQAPAEAGLRDAQAQQQQWQERHDAAADEVARDLAQARGAIGTLATGLAALHRELSVGRRRLQAWAAEAEAAAGAVERELSAAAAAEADAPPMPSVPMPRELEMAGEEGTGAVGAGVELDEAWRGVLLQKHHEQEKALLQGSRDAEAQAEAAGREAAGAAAAVAEAAAVPLRAAQGAVSDLKARRELARSQLVRARLSVQDNGAAATEAGAGDAAAALTGNGHHHLPRVHVPDASQPNGPRSSTAVQAVQAVGAEVRVPPASAVRPQCDQCLQPIDPAQFLGKLRRLEEEAAELEARYVEALSELRRCEDASQRAIAAARDAQAAWQTRVQEARAQERQKAEALRRTQRAELEAREAEARAALAAAHAERERARAVARAARDAALAAWRREQDSARAAWEAARREAAEAARRRQAALQAARASLADVRAVEVQLQAAARQLAALRTRWQTSQESEGLWEAWRPEEEEGDSCQADSVGLDVPSEQRRRALARLQSVAAGATEAVERVDAALQRTQLLRGRAEALVRELNPFTLQADTLRSQLEALLSEIEQQRGRLAALRQRHAVLDEADKALGRGGVPSFVLEGVLGELQGRTEGYLEQLSDTMVLELSATRPTASAAKAAAASAAAAPAKARSKRATAAAAAAAAAEAGAGSDVEGSSTDTAAASTSRRGAKATAARDGEEKEQISKIVKVRSGEQLLPRSVAQLSGGERRRVALALALGFADLVRNRGRLKSNLLVLDEVLQQLDGEGCARVAAVLKALPHASVLVVGQAHSFVTQAFEVVDTVVKRQGSACVECS